MVAHYTPMDTQDQRDVHIWMLLISVLYLALVVTCLVRFKLLLRLPQRIAASAVDRKSVV